MKKTLSLLLIVLFAASSAFAASVDTLLVSSKMGRQVEVVVVAPQAAAAQPCAVLYLLHGFGGDHNYWLSIAPLEQFAEQYNLHIVCPNGNNSWYWDSPIEPSMQYETFISEELPAFVDEHYNTLALREGRAITGLSMGGHGALWNALRHGQTFGAAGSMSGGVDICPFPENWSMKQLLGERDANLERWRAHSVISEVGRLEQPQQAIIIDCGVADFFLEVNRNLHALLIERNIDHDYIEREGEHNAAYWRNSIHYQMLFFHRYFTQSK